MVVVGRVLLLLIASALAFASCARLFQEDPAAGAVGDGQRRGSTTADPAGSSSPVKGGRAIYVDIGAVGQGDGSPRTPFRTIDAAADVARAGDAILVAPGTYRDTVRIAASGTLQRPITVRPERSGTVVIDGASTAADTDLVTIAGDYVRFEGFNVVNARRSGISLWGTRGVVVRGNTVSRSVRSGIWAGYAALGRSDGPVIDGNVVAWNCLENVGRDWKGGWPRAIAVDYSTNPQVTNNIVHSNYGEGIGFLSTIKGEIIGNTVYDNFSVNIYLDNAPYSVVLGNEISTTQDRRFFRNGRPAHSVLIANEFTDHPMKSEGIEVANNTIIGLEEPQYGYFQHGTGLFGSSINNNTLID